ncbi:hypothetical protein HF1_08100 [Mycoplasma haemofelis str. Langford 1]|uniref:Uncharacterized protein n=1 Tax=Mycoplasma haemofelis (strain Langford 1) TaxID=941640 RepID=E8ZI47_MYCHL|nr:hypothetical protein [Mycoplasma haemofelis]CBY92818.1 hypothetical protein HF1_08100 [Mycoplasma haemofelis str. Langford 1]
MSKLTLPLLGVGGAGIASAGGYMIFSEKGYTQTKKSETFRSRYAPAILGVEDKLWDSKFTSFKQSGNPKHPTLASAKSKSSSAEDSEAKDLYKRGCQEIYDSAWEDSSYFDDFKSYCVKTVKEGIGDSKTWINEETTNKGKWDTKLTSLKTHNQTQNKVLDKKLEDLKTQLSNISEFQESHRKLLKEWCSSSQGEIFMGNGDPIVTHSTLYCVEP